MMKKMILAPLMLVASALFAMSLICVDAAASSPVVDKEPPAKVGWIVDGAQAKSLISQGALVWDVRSKSSFMLSHVKGAVHVSWQEFSPAKGPDRGTLVENAKLTAALRRLGVSQQRAIVVVGDPKKGWGEEGRLVWMLRSLGHDRAAFVDGGFDALTSHGVTTQAGGSSKVKPGDFQIKSAGRYAVDTARLRGLLKQPEAVTIVDTREQREYEGKTPYGESRGGHVPGAVHLHFKDLLGQDGLLLPKPKLEAKLKALGIERAKPVVAYCTGGIRSGWFVAVLHHLGYQDAQNYAGSMWQWSAGDAELNPLVK